MVVKLHKMLQCRRTIRFRYSNRRFIILLYSRYNQYLQYTFTHRFYCCYFTNNKTHSYVFRFCRRYSHMFLFFCLPMDQTSASDIKFRLLVPSYKKFVQYFLRTSRTDEIFGRTRVHFTNGSTANTKPTGSVPCTVVYP